MTDKPGYRRITCIGYGAPCPFHAWWYEKRKAGGVTKRCPGCSKRVRWTNLTIAQKCLDCGAPINLERGRGRPRKRCEDCVKAGAWRRKGYVEPNPAQQEADGGGGVSG